jgi:hypothetical protein
MNLKDRVKRLESGPEKPPPVVVKIDAAGVCHCGGVDYPDKASLMESLPPGRMVLFFYIEPVENIDEWEAMAKNPNPPMFKVLDTFFT